MTTKTTKKPKSTKQKGKYYIDRKELLAEVVASKKLGRMSDRLATMLVLLTTKYAKSPQFIGYSFNDDMQGYAKMMLVRTWNSFNPEKSDNPFAFYTQCIKNSFIQYLNKEKKHRNIRDALLVDVGLSPSYAYQSECQERQDEIRNSIHDEEDHEQFMEDVKRLHSNTTESLDDLNS